MDEMRIENRVIENGCLSRSKTSKGIDRLASKKVAYSPKYFFLRLLFHPWQQQANDQQ